MTALAIILPLALVVLVGAYLAWHDFTHSEHWSLGWALRKLEDQDAARDDANHDLL